MTRNRTRLSATLLFAATVLGCAPGDHSNNSDLTKLFGGAAGKSAQTKPGDEDGEKDDSDLSGTAASGAVDWAPSGGAGAQSAAPGNAGTASAPLASSGMDAAASGTGSTSGAGGASVSPMPAGTNAMAPPTSAAPPAVDPATGAVCEEKRVSVAGQCVCDLNGTFALQGRLPVNLEGTGPLESISDTTLLWAIVRNNYDVQGNLELSLTLCGQTTPDICVAAQAPIVPTAEAYAQYIPVEAWERPMTVPITRMSVTAPLPGAAFTTPPLVQLFGISLKNPLGPWPASRKKVEGGSDFDGSATNGASWVDIDGDGKLGVTIKVVGPGGVEATATSGPPTSYGANSKACPRSNPQAARSPYAYLPMPQGLGVKRVKALFSAQRTVMELHGNFDSCDRISGKVTGPNGGAIRADALIGGCATVNGSGEAACTAAMLDSAESGTGGTTSSSAGLELGAGDFVLARVQPDASCSQVRALNLN